MRRHPVLVILAILSLGLSLRAQSHCNAVRRPVPSNSAQHHEPAHPDSGYRLPEAG